MRRARPNSPKDEAFDPYTEVDTSLLIAAEISHQTTQPKDKTTSLISGAYGTRTRNLCRDRAAL